MVKKIIALFILLFTSTIVFSQVKINAPKEVQPNESFQVEVVVSNNASLKEVSFGNLNVHGQSTSSMVSIINGKMTSSESYTFTLSANSEGEYPIGPFTASLEGKNYTSNKVVVKITKDAPSQRRNTQQYQDPFDWLFGNNSASQRRQQQQQQQAQTQERNPEPAVETPKNPNGDLFIETSTDKKEYYVGQQIILTATMYSRMNIGGFNKVEFPTFKGCWSTDIYNPSNISFKQKNISGYEYLYAVLQKKALFANKVGNITIDPYEIGCVITDSWGFPKGNRVAKSKSFQVKIKPLPEGKPEDFSGAVGQFSISASVDKSEIKLDEPFTLSVSVNGKGNLQLFNAPNIDLGSNFEKYDPKVVDKFSAKNDGLQGSKIFNYVVIPRQNGEFTLPEIVFNYFDPDSKSYKSCKTQSISLKVLGQRDSTQTAYIQSVVPTEIDDLNSDIKYIKTKNFKLSKSKDYFFNSIWFWMLFIALIFGFFVFVFLHKQQIKNNQNIALVKQNKAGKVSKKRLKKASQFIKENKEQEFYVESLRVLWGYIGDKLSISAEKLTRENIGEKLSEKQIDESVKEQFISILDSLEFERYAPQSNKLPLLDVYNKVAQAIENIEQQFKKA